MVYRRRRIVISEIDRQCRFVMMAYGDAAAALQAKEAERLWYSLEGLITAATRLHELLWPSPDPSVEWAAELRSTLGATDESPLNCPQLSGVAPLLPTLESWNLQKPGQPPLLTNFGPAGFTEPSPAECVRCFSPQFGRFTLFGATYEVTSLLHAVADLAPRVAQEVEALRSMV